MQKKLNSSRIILICWFLGFIEANSFKSWISNLPILLASSGYDNEFKENKITLWFLTISVKSFSITMLFLIVHYKYLIDSKDL
ncbi:hypothetical protein SAP269_21190 [Spiroplasma ixodetis]|uniref:Uncharacterized protein n=1 Tax=Spiroplasma ixodetis TaxID=2141 RepID=A0ABN7BXM4_9MOLU